MSAVLDQRLERRQQIGCGGDQVGVGFVFGVRRKDAAALKDRASNVALDTRADVDVAHQRIDASDPRSGGMCHQCFLLLGLSSRLEYDSPVPGSPTVPRA